MEEVRDLVVQTLEKKHVLSRLKAELRSEVFLAIDQEAKAAGAKTGLGSKTENARRESLRRTADGRLTAGLVREFLEWSGMQFTLKVFDPEMDAEAPAPSRRELTATLGLTDADSEEPLLLHILRTRGSRASQSGHAAPRVSEPQAIKSRQSIGSTASDILDVELEGAEIIDEDEDYTEFVGRQSHKSGLGAEASMSDVGRQLNAGEAQSRPEPDSVTSKAGKLAPLAPLGKAAPLAPIAAASVPSARRDADVVKAELRKAGLLNQTQSYSDADFEAPQSDARPIPSVRPVQGGVYDAEVSVMTSVEDIPDELEVAGTHDLESADEDRREGSTSRRNVYLTSHQGLSMELKETGLSASDRSGELHADFAETAEWS